MFSLPRVPVAVDVVPERLPPGPVSPLLVVDVPAVAPDVDDHPLVRTEGVLLPVVRLVEKVATLGTAAILLLLTDLHWGWRLPGGHHDLLLPVVGAVIVLLHHWRRSSSPASTPASASEPPGTPGGRSRGLDPLTVLRPGLYDDCGQDSQAPQQGQQLHFYLCEL